MRIYPKLQAADAKEMSRQGELAFTMIEIAIAIGVIGFALVAIIGILPTGLDVQKDNREDTLISQDAPYFLDAIRNGAAVTTINGSNYIASSAQGLDFLTNYVQTVRFDNVENGVTNQTIIRSNFTSGAEIIGLLTTPQNTFALAGFSSNYFDTTATVRALSGPATEQQTGGNTGLSSVMAFTYQVEVMVTPFNSFPYFTTNWFAYSQVQNADPNEVIIRSNRWVEATLGYQLPYSPYLAPASGGLTYSGGLLYVAPVLGGTNFSGGLIYNLFDVRLRFSWPVLQNGRVGPGRQTYRTLIAAQIAPASTNGVAGWFFQPQRYATIPPNSL
jgi:type II secretory pathway pseudopilin PulG